MTSSEKTPKVSVCVITFNQEQYIRQCLQSIVDQKTDFDFDVIVGEDCSTDGTRLIVQEFEERYPGIVKPIYQEKNIGGGVHNFSTVHNAAVGEYIAHMDGDDYCLPGKLQAQADLLDNDSNCNIVWHRMLIEISGVTYEGSLQVNNIEELILDRGNIIQYMALAGHSSKMYRKSVRAFDVPDFDMIDTFINVEQVRGGVARFAGSKYYGVYRMGMGISSSGSKSRKLLAKSFFYFYNKYPEHRLEVNTAVLVCLLGDIKNRRETWKVYLLMWIKTFQIGSILNFMRSLKFLKSTTLKKELIKANLSEIIARQA